MSKYDPLHRWLDQQGGSHIRLSFSKLAQILGDALPQTARCRREWWANEASPDTRHVQCRAWLEAGWQVAEVELQAEQVTFKRLQKGV